MYHKIKFVSLYNRVRIAIFALAKEKEIQTVS